MTPFESLGICKGFKRVRETKGEAWQIALPFLRTVSFNWLLGHSLPGLFFASSSCSWGHLPAPAPQKNTHTHIHIGFLKNQFRHIFKTLQRNPDSPPKSTKRQVISPELSSLTSPPSTLPLLTALQDASPCRHTPCTLWPLTLTFICPTAWNSPHHLCMTPSSLPSDLSSQIPADRSSLTTEIASLPPSLFLPPVHHHWLYLSCMLSVCRWNVIFIKTGTASGLSL